MEIKFDTNSFELTAKAVFTMNDSCSEKYDDWEHLMGFMEFMAYQYSVNEGSGFFSTSGFCLTGFTTVLSDGSQVRHVVATVMAYTAQCFIDEVRDVVNR